MAGVSEPSHGFVEFSSDWAPSRTEQSGCHPRNTLCNEICAHAICRKFGGRTFLRQFFCVAVVQKTRVNTGGKDGGPGRDRTDDLFHAMEARSQLRHRPTIQESIRTGIGKVRREFRPNSILPHCLAIVKPGLAFCETVENLYSERRNTGFPHPRTKHIRGKPTRKCRAMKSLRFLPILLASSLAGQVPPDQQSTNPAPVSYASMSQLNTLLGDLEQTSQNSTADLRSLRIDRWKTDGNTKRQEQSDVESVLRNLQNALPGLVTELRNSPEDMAATFKLYHNLDALHDVMRSVAESAGAFGSKSEYQALAADAEKLDEVRRSLAARMQTLARSKEAEVVRLRAQLKAAQAAPPPPPQKIVVDDTE